MTNWTPETKGAATSWSLENKPSSSTWQTEERPGNPWEYDDATYYYDSPSTLSYDNFGTATSWSNESK